ncbi:MAG: NADH-quinone oxidoreductase subunit L, partial [Pseudomonadota bacterium]|nr:NADH-quinone oxidoreductase subunit L [Pseudomonadota bacterium]
SAVVAALVAAVALPVLGYAAAHEAPAGLGRLIALLLLFVGAMELLVVAADLLTLLIGWEVVGACSWALIGHEWRDAANPRSAAYAFLMTRFGDVGLFVAAMAVFAATGSFAYADIARLDGPALLVVMLGVLLSAASKSGQLPFSPWLFRAMAGPTSVSALLHAATMVAAGAYLLARLQPVLDRSAFFAPLVITIGLATALAGGVVALLQGHAKKLLAASTSAHFGLMFVAVGVGYPAVAILHLVAHAFFKALLFLSAGVAGQRGAGYTLAGMRLERALPFVAAASAAGSVALAGLPPFGGAWTKDEIVAAAGHASPWLALGVVVAGGLSAAYATRFQLLAFGQRFGFGADRDGGPPRQRIVNTALAALALASLGLSILWLDSGRAAASRLTGSQLPDASTAQFVASLLAVILGLLLGRLLVQRRPALGEEPGIARIADWLQLPALWQRAVISPAGALAGALARFDDSVIDAVAIRGIGGLGRTVARVLARGDRLVVDRGVGATARFVERVAAVGSGTAEWIVDGLPEGLARFVGFGGDDARALQSGLSHRYYAVLAIGATLLFATLMLGT